MKPGNINNNFIFGIVKDEGKEKDYAYN